MTPGPGWRRATVSRWRGRWRGRRHDGGVFAAALRDVVAYRRAVGNGAEHHFRAMMRRTAATAKGSGLPPDRPCAVPKAAPPRAEGGLAVRDGLQGASEPGRPSG